jgi:hypothetical protein|tara:strand:+ start:5020 stop:5385 length:366 start_codon:yes stop_codon:yes gene_type:complete
MKTWKRDDENVFINNASIMGIYNGETENQLVLGQEDWDDVEILIVKIRSPFSKEVYKIINKETGQSKHIHPDFMKEIIKLFGYNFRIRGVNDDTNRISFLSTTTNFAVVLATLDPINEIGD